MLSKHIHWLLWFLALSMPARIMADIDTSESHKKSNTMSANVIKSATRPIRIATFNIGLDEARTKGQLAQLLQSGQHAQARKSAEIIQKVRPDILLINEIDGNDGEQSLSLYMKKYLGINQGKDKAIHYPYHYMPDCNTGVDSGVHFRVNEHDDAATDATTDKYGFGHYDGQYCMAVLSMFPIDRQGIKSFQTFLWKDFPNARLPQNPENRDSWYSKQGLEHFRLSSKTHADVPVKIQEQTLHLLISHPTPPVFDGPEDRNGRRNFDEILFWKHYINGDTSWLNDDNGKAAKGLNDTSRFVILGDLNASILEGDASEFAVPNSQSGQGPNAQRAIALLLKDKHIAKGFSETDDGSKIPSSFGGKENSPDNLWSQYHTAGWKMRADYVLPSAWGLKTTGSGVFWPKMTSKDAPLVNDSQEGKSSSDHRLVWLDVLFTKSDLLTNGKTSTQKSSTKKPADG